MSSKTPAAGPNGNCRQNIMNRFSVLQKCWHKPMVVEGARFHAQTSKPAALEASQKEKGELMGPLLGKDGRSSEFEEQCQWVMCQIDATASAQSPAGPSTPLQGVIEGKIKPLVVSNPLTPLPSGPDFLHWAMEQCGLWLSKHGGLVPINLDSPDISPSATLGLRALRVLPTGLNLGSAGELHHTLVA